MLLLSQKQMQNFVSLKSFRHCIIVTLNSPPVQFLNDLITCYFVQYVIYYGLDDKHVYIMSSLLLRVN